MPRFRRISNPLDQLPDLLKLLVETQVKQPVDDAVWAFTNPVDRLMGKGRAEGGQMAFPLGGKKPSWKQRKTPGGMTVHELDEFRIEVYRKPGWRSHTSSGYYPSDIKLFRDNKLLQTANSVKAAKERALREIAKKKESKPGGRGGV